MTIGWRPEVPSDPLKRLPFGRTLRLLGNARVGAAAPRDPLAEAARHERAAGRLPPEAPPTPAGVRRLRWAVGIGGLAWLAAGAIEVVHHWLGAGLWVAAVGIVALRTAPGLGRTRTDDRLRESSRSRTVAWWAVALCGPIALARVVWLLATGAW
jgi:hypothetical protein